MTAGAGIFRPRLLVAVAFAAMLGSCARHQFLRVSEDECGGSLEAAWVWLDPPAGCPPILLVNMIHFGTPDYYEEVQCALDRASVVFLEGIRGMDSRFDPASRPADELTQLDRAMTDLAFELRLVTQREALQPRSDYISVDWTAEELKSRVALQGFVRGIPRLRETVQRIVDYEVARLRDKYPGLTDEELAAFVRRGPLRRQVAERLVEPPIEHQSIIKERNAEVLRALRGIPPGGLVAICYGADHGPHLVRGLVRMGYEKRSVSWHRVFGFDREPHPDVMPRP